MPQPTNDGVTFDRKIKRSDLNVVISRPRLSMCPLSNGSLFYLSYVIGSVQVNGLRSMP